MSYPGRDTFVSPSTSNVEKQRKIDEFSTEKLSYYIAEDGEIERETPPASPVKPAPTIKKSLKLKNTAASTMPKAAKGETPFKPVATEDEPPKRKSPRVAGRKRKVTDDTTADTKAAPSSPLAKKSKHVTTSDDIFISPAAKVGSKPKFLKNLAIDAEAGLSNPFANELKPTETSEEPAIKPLPAIKTGRKRKVLGDTSSDAEEALPNPPAKKLRLPKAPISASMSYAAAFKGGRRSDAAKSSRTLKKSTKNDDAFTGIRTPAVKNSSTSTRLQNGISKKKAFTPELHSDADASEEEQPAPTKKGKGKKNDLEARFKEFENSGLAKASGKGHSTTRPDIEICTLEEPWKCGNRMCLTGMTWVPRSDAEKQGGVGRKACSHFFGRNKKETGYIHEDVWHWYCRKCYQRDQYKAKAQKNDPNHTVLTQLHIDFLKNQIVRLQLWRPDMTFTVQLTKRAQDRLGQFHKAIHRPGTSEVEAIAAVAPVTKQSAKGKDVKPSIEYEFDIKSIEHFDYTYTGRDKTFADLFAICDWLQALNDVGAAPCDPPIEFLPSAEIEGENVVDPVANPDNYDRWAAHCDGETNEENQNGSDEDEDDDDEGDKKDDDDEDTKDDDETIDAPLTDNEDGDVKPPPGIDEDSDSEDGGEDDDTPRRPLPKASIYGATVGYLTPLGKRLGLTGKESLRQGIKCVESIPMAVAEERQREKERLRREQKETEEAAKVMLQLADGEGQSEETGGKETAAHALMKLHDEDAKL